MLLSLLLAFNLATYSTPTPIAAGWTDELNTISSWAPRDGGMRAEAYSESPGAMTLRLAHVPDGFPYSYQWGGVTREATVDLGRYPVLVARVLDVRPRSYTHLDVESRDYSGKPVTTLRTPTLVKGGLIVFDLGDTLGTDVRRLTLRINVGGAPEGAKCTYGWVRFVSRKGLALLRAHPDLQDVVLRP
jgi:hypothetical protein